MLNQSDRCNQSTGGPGGPRRTLPPARAAGLPRSEEHTSELQSPCNLVCRLLLYKEFLIHGPICVSAALYLRALISRPSRASASCGHARTPDRAQVIHNAFTSYFFNDTATTEIYTLSLHDALPI